MMNIKMTSLLMAAWLSATSVATFAASGEGPGATGTAPGATRSSTMLPDSNRPSAPSTNNGRARAPARQWAAPASMVRAVARVEAPVHPAAEPAVLAAGRVAGQAKAANDTTGSKSTSTIGAHQCLATTGHRQRSHAVPPRMLGLIQRRIRPLDKHVHAVPPRGHERIATQADRHVAIG